MQKINRCLKMHNSDMQLPVKNHNEDMQNKAKEIEEIKVEEE